MLTSRNNYYISLGYFNQKAFFDKDRTHCNIRDQFPKISSKIIVEHR